MGKLRDHLKKGNSIIADGANGAMLQQMYSGNSSCLEELVLTRPDLIEAIAQLYFDAGAALLQTNTFGGSPLRLAMYGLEDQTEEINRKAAELVRNVAGNGAWITGSCGPCGRHLPPFGDLKDDYLLESCKRQLGALAEGGVDAFSIETMMDVEEAVIAIKAAREVSPETPLMVSVILNSTQQGLHTPFGTALKDAVQRFTDEGADVIGSNCGNGMGKMIMAAREFCNLSRIPILIRPSAGLPEIVNGVPVWPENPVQFAEGVRKLLDIGVRIIGGCCGTTPEHIRLAKNTFDEWIEAV